MLRIVSVAILLLGLVTYSTAIQSYSKVFKHSDRQVYYGHQSYRNNSLTYAVCEKPQNATYRKCELILKKNLLDNDTKDAACSFALRVDGGENKKLNDVVRVINFGSNKVIVVSWEQPRVQPDEDEVKADVVSTITILDFSRCKPNANRVTSKTADFANHDDWLFNVQVIPYDDSYDVIYPSQEVCKEKLCRETFNAKGERIGKTSGWISKQTVSMMSVDPVKPYSPSLGHAVVESTRNPNQLTLYYSSKNYELAPMRNYTFIGPKGYGHSVAHGIISLCSQQIAKIVMCSKFDTKGNIKFEKSLTFNYTLHTMYMHNSRSGGFLFLTASKGSLQKSYDEGKKMATYDVTRFDGQGEFVTTMKIESLACENKLLSARFFERKNDEHCLVFACLYSGQGSESPGNDGTLEMEFRCFNDKDLMVKL